jgi:hypothetical protein
MATIKIQKASFYLHRPGSVQFYIDGQQQLSNFEGTTEIIEINPGYHTLIAKSTWVSSQELSFNIRYNETKTFEVGVTKAVNIFYLLFVFMIIMPFLHSPEYLNYDVLIPTTLIVLVLLYATFRRKEYFTLKEL